MDDEAGAGDAGKEAGAAGWGVGAHRRGGEGRPTQVQAITSPRWCRLVNAGKGGGWQVHLRDGRGIAEQIKPEKVR